MALLDILLYPDPKLRKKSSEVAVIDGGIHLLLDNMRETMREVQGIGLSAPQVGRNIRVAIVCDARDAEKEKRRRESGQAGTAADAGEMPVIEMINPVITDSSGRGYATEGCLSIPGFLARVRRKESVEVEWLTRDGEKERMKVGGLTARIIQHETDHLDGVLFVDRLSGLKKEMMLKKMEKTFGAAEEKRLR